MGKKKPVGRPNELLKRFKSLAGLQKAIDTYFKANAEHPTITGLSMHLGTTRQGLLDSINSKDLELSDAIKKAKTRVENFYEQGLMSKFTIGSIFALKNFGWSDKQHITHDGEVAIKKRLFDD